MGVGLSYPRFFIFNFKFWEILKYSKEVFTKSAWLALVGAAFLINIFILAPSNWLLRAPLLLFEENLGVLYLLRYGDFENPLPELLYLIEVLFLYLLLLYINWILLHHKKG